MGWEPSTDLCDWNELQEGEGSVMVSYSSIIQ